MNDAIRLLVSDVDGTLVDKQKRLAPATVEAVRRLRAAGIGFTVISARPRSGVMPIADALEIDEPMAAFNGGMVFRRDGWIGEHHVIDRTVAEGVVAMVKGAAVDLWVFADDAWHATTDQGAHVASERVSANQQPVLRDDFSDLLDRADKITLVSDDPHVLADLMARAQAAFDGRATIAMSQTYYLDITAVQANKGDGIVALTAALGVDLAQTAAIGDQGNDVPMLKRAALSFAMGNAPDAVKATAQGVTDANDADGVAHAIDRILSRISGAAK